MGRVRAVTALLLSLLAAAGVAACQGCHTPRPSTVDPAAGSTKPTVRLYVISTLAGALEPCGCTKDQLGGVNHLAAYLASQSAVAPDHLTLAAGPLLFGEPTLKGDDATQASWKAGAIALAAKELGLAAWAPGINDWAAGADALGRYRDEAGAKLLAGNVSGAPGAVATAVREVGGIKVGLIGVADPRDRLGHAPDGVTRTAPLEAMRAGLAAVKQQGARVFIGLAALQRGEALRLADELPELHVLVLGKTVETGEANDGQKPPVLAGSTLVVEAANHLQTVAVIDLFVREGGAPGAPLVFADAGGVAKASELISLSTRIRDLEGRLDSWERERNVKADDVAARKADLEKLRGEKLALEAAQPPTPGSFFRYTSLEVRDRLGNDPAIASQMSAYYKRVNEHNKAAFADRKPPSVETGQASYVGIEACTICHDEPRKVWDGTLHAGAYPTLAKQFKEFNLECVSCHLTAYGKAGGSTVTFNDKLQNVQCEECHGPGSLHVKTPKQKGLVIAKPSPDMCVSACHHPPHVEGFDAKEKIKLILGPGHGLPSP